jgi:hypothetical protein
VQELELEGCHDLLRSTATKKNMMGFDFGSQLKDYNKHSVMQLSPQMVVEPKEENFPESVELQETQTH